MNYKITALSMARHIIRLIEQDKPVHDINKYGRVLKVLPNDTLIFQDAAAAVNLKIPLYRADGLTIFNHDEFIEGVARSFKGASKYKLNIFMELIKGDYWRKNAKRKQLKREYQRRHGNNEN